MDFYFTPSLRPNEGTNIGKAFRKSKVCVINSTDIETPCEYLPPLYAGERETNWFIKFELNVIQVRLEWNKMSKNATYG